LALQRNTEHAELLLILTRRNVEQFKSYIEEQTHTQIIQKLRTLVENRAANALEHLLSPYITLSSQVSNTHPQALLSLQERIDLLQAWSIRRNPFIRQKTRQHPLAIEFKHSPSLLRHLMLGLTPAEQKQLYRAIPLWQPPTLFIKRAAFIYYFRVLTAACLAGGLSYAFFYILPMLIAGTLFTNPFTLLPALAVSAAIVSIPAIVFAVQYFIRLIQAGLQYYKDTQIVRIQWKAFQQSQNAPPPAPDPSHHSPLLARSESDDTVQYAPHATPRLYRFEGSSAPEGGVPAQTEQTPAPAPEARPGASPSPRF
jgi:hypothetical protein